MFFKKHFKRKNNISSILLIIIILLLNEKTKAQQHDLIVHHNPINFFNINFSKGELPKDLLRERTVGIVFSDQNMQNKKEVWKEIVQLSHPTFAKLGVDIVAWYNAKEIALSRNRREILSEILKKREIKYIVFFFFEKNILTLRITKFNNKKTLISANQPSWMIENNKMDILLSKLRRTVINNNFEKTNFLTVDFPEFHILNRKKYAVNRNNVIIRYVPNLKSITLNINLPPKTPIKALLPNEKQIDSLLFNDFLKKYPFKYKVISPTIPNDYLIKKKEFYRLFWVYGTPQEIVKTYHIDTTRWKQNNEGSAIPISNESFYKPMVKNIYTDKISCGNQWDGAKNPLLAMEKFIENIKL